MPSALTLPKSYFLALFSEAILHGIFTVLAAGTVYILIHKRIQQKRQKERSTRINMAMVLLTALMYGLSTTHLALSLHLNMVAFFDQHAAEEGVLSILNDQGNPIIYSQIALEVVNCLIGDAIVCWRVWVIWGRSHRVIAAPMLFIIGGLVSGIGMVHAFSASLPGQDLYNKDIMNWFLAFGALTCGTNIYCVISISYKAWDARAIFRTLHQQGQPVVMHGGRYHNVVLIIAESGLLYSVTLIITIILFACDNNGVNVIADMLAHLTGIYPTIIIVLVSLRMSFHDDIIRAERSISTFQAQSINALNTNANMQRGRRGADEGEAVGNAFILESFAERSGSTLDLRGTALSEGSKGSTKGDSIV